MAGLDAFAKRMSRIAVEVEGNVEQAMKDCATAVAKSVVEGTPVDTGKARSNWLAGIDAPVSAEIEPHVPGIAGSTGDANAEAAIDQASAVIETFNIAKNSSIHVTNNLPYIGALNDGHSRQAPTDFVKLAVMDGLATVKGAKILEE
jgi:Flp pilus assembly protein TadD